VMADRKKLNGSYPRKGNGAASAAPMTDSGPVIADLGITKEEVALAKEAWARIQADYRKTRDDYKFIGAKHMVGRKWALKKANKHRPEGQRYCKAFKQWLEATGMDKVLPERTRERLLWIMENLARGVAGRLQRGRAGRVEPSQHHLSRRAM
jgi:hypothetical protein